MNTQKIILIVVSLIAEITGYTLLFLVNWKLALGIILILAARNIANKIKIIK